MGSNVRDEKLASGADIKNIMTNAFRNKKILTAAVSLTLSLRRFSSALAIVALASPAAKLMAKSHDWYGVWARGGNADTSAFPFKGIEFDGKWAEIEPKEGVFDWKELDASLSKAADEGLHVLLSVNVGPDSPKWLYEKGIPKAMTSGHRHAGPYPFYPDPRHVASYHRLIEEFGRHARNLPPRLLERIAYVQVKTGATGDESPYKGNLRDARYAITDPQWTEFRLAAFQKYHVAFQQGPGPVIPLMFASAADPERYPELLKWITANVKVAWGTKMNGTGQGYQLNGETWRTQPVLRHSVDPAPGAFELFTRCEMDQGWQEGIFARNIHQAFYWTSLSAVHSGLSMWNITPTAIRWHQKTGYWEDFKFFNKYAGQTRAAEATGAFCALREGLDAADAKKFPESVYGEVSGKDAKRLLAICASRAAYGAKMEDVGGVDKGMMHQRRNQEGLNDVGFEVFPGNYERFLHQIDPDKTSVGWWRVEGEITANSPVYGRFARGFEHSSGKNTMGFALKDSFFGNKTLKGAYPVTVRVVYFDKGKGQWALHYDAVGDPNKKADIVTKTDTGKWMEKVFTLKDANFGKAGWSGSDLSLVNVDAEDDIFHMVEITRPSPVEAKNPAVQK